MNGRPWRAALLSGLVCPGVGQLYNRQYGKGLALVAATLALVAALLIQVARATWDRVVENPELADPLQALVLAREIERENASLFAGLTLVCLGLWAFAVWDAWRVASRRRVEPHAP